MDILGISFKAESLTLLTLAGACLTLLIKQWFATSREKQAAFRAAATKLRETFSPALARLENARTHGSTHDIPDVDGLLEGQFEIHSAAVQEFSHFVGVFHRRGYKKAWAQYCEVARADNVSPVFMASGIDERCPYSEIERLIRSILEYAKN